MFSSILLMKAPCNSLSLVSDCAEMVRSHYRFSYVASEDRLTAASLRDCSNKCSRETYCNTFSFR